MGGHGHSRTFKKYDVLETSYHFYTDRIDLHFCDDPGGGRSEHPQLEGGGAFQVSLASSSSLPPSSSFSPLLLAGVPGQTAGGLLPLPPGQGRQEALGEVLHRLAPQDVAAGRPSPVRHPAAGRAARRTEQDSPEQGPSEQVF